MKTKTTSDDALFMVTRSYPNASREYEQHKNLNLVHLEIEMADKPLPEVFFDELHKLIEKFTSQSAIIFPFFIGDKAIIKQSILRQMEINNFQFDGFEIIEIVASDCFIGKREFESEAYMFYLSEVSSIIRK